MIETNGVTSILVFSISILHFIICFETKSVLIAIGVSTYHVGYLEKSIQVPHVLVVVKTNTKVIRLIRPPALCFASIEEQLVKGIHSGTECEMYENLE